MSTNLLARICRTWRPIVVAAALTVPLTLAFGPMPVRGEANEHAPNDVMLILRGIAAPEKPRGQLDDKAALEYARRQGLRGEVLDVAGDNSADSPQVVQALDRIRKDITVTALYGFSGGGYNARRIWAELTSDERKRIAIVIVIGSAGVNEGDFPEVSELIISEDPPEGHLAGPKALLETVEEEGAGQP